MSNSPQSPILIFKQVIFTVMSFLLGADTRCPNILEFTAVKTGFNRVFNAATKRGNISLLKYEKAERRNSSKGVEQLCPSSLQERARREKMASPFRWAFAVVFNRTGYQPHLIQREIPARCRSPRSPAQSTLGQGRERRVTFNRNQPLNFQF